MDKIEELGKDLDNLRNETWLKNAPKQHRPKYTEEDINRIIGLKGFNGEQIDIFKLHGVLFVGNTKDRMWDLTKRYVRYSEHSIGLSIEDFEYCETEDDVNEQWHESFKAVVKERLL